MGNTASTTKGADDFYEFKEWGKPELAIVPGDLLVSLTYSPYEYIVIKKEFEKKAPRGGENKWDIPREEFSMDQIIGAGNFGKVYKGKMNGKVIAIKISKGGQMSTKEFLAEAEIMKKCQHENLVELLGICTDQKQIFIISEFMSNGSLLDYMKTKKSLQLDAMIGIAAQIANGMAFLESKRIVHRDLAARNVLIGKDKIAKVADFGLARLLPSDQNVYTSRGSGFPIKWTAPEGFRGEFTTKSDVWSFGIVVIEIMNKGREPYPGIANGEILQKLESGYRQPKPENCPQELYDAVISCWQENPTRRPSFASLYATLRSMQIV
ncbi:LCK [Mytilus edulis]|uniref:non-specific protein-tyrosine kinase n=1 Tax=Mytilus edulis TaxID=6550 RepID=A0A8S3PSM4_MYTED|nr:LCK [Mytilus edulis]